MSRFRAAAAGCGRRVFSDRWTFSISRTAAGFCAAALYAAVCGAAFAEEPEEVPLGTFQIQGGGVTLGEPAPGGGHAADPAPSEPRGWFLPRYEAGLAESPAQRRAMLTSAERDLKAGRMGSAQRALERLIGEAPDTEEAGAARKHLAELYRNAAAAGEGEQAGSDGAASTVPVASEIDDQFIAEVGDRVFFESGEARLGPRALAVIQSQARFLKRRPELAAIVEGHVDDGALSVDDMEQLATARAQAVRDRLVAEGINPNRLAIISKGRDERIASCGEAECQKQNRRAVTVLMAGLPGFGAPPARAAQRMRGPGSPQPATQ